MKHASCRWAWFCFDSRFGDFQPDQSCNPSRYDYADRFEPFKGF